MAPDPGLSRDDALTLLVIPNGGPAAGGISRHSTHDEIPARDRFALLAGMTRSCFSSFPRKRESSHRPLTRGPRSRP